MRGRVHLHFDTAADAEQALVEDGFEGIAHDPRDFAHELPDMELEGAGRVRIIEAIARG